MMGKVTHKIRVRHHFKKHHKAYLLWWFSLFAIVQTFSLLFGAFSKASYDDIMASSGNASEVLEIENSLHSQIFGNNSIADIFSQFFNWNAGNNLVAESKKNLLIYKADTETLALNDVFNGEFDEFSWEVLDLSQDNDLIQDSKLLKNLTIEKLQENNNSRKLIKFPIKNII